MWNQTYPEHNNATSVAILLHFFASETGYTCTFPSYQPLLSFNSTHMIDTTSRWHLKFYPLIVWSFWVKGHCSQGSLTTAQLLNPGIIEFMHAWYSLLDFERRANLLATVLWSPMSVLIMIMKCESNKTTDSNSVVYSSNYASCQWRIVIPSISLWVGCQQGHLNCLHPEAKPPFPYSEISWPCFSNHYWSWLQKRTQNKKKQIVIWPPRLDRHAIFPPHRGGKVVWRAKRRSA